MASDGSDLEHKTAIMSHGISKSEQLLFGRFTGCGATRTVPTHGGGRGRVTPERGRDHDHPDQLPSDPAAATASCAGRRPDVAGSRTPPGLGVASVEAQVAPSIAALNPISGPISGGASVTFGGTPAGFAVQNDDVILATSPAHAAGLVDVVVTTPDGSNADTAADDFTYIAAGVTVTQSGGSSNVTEGGVTDSYTVVLIAAPTGNVTLTVVDSAQLDATPNTRSFTPGDWFTPQTITVTAVDDGIIEGTHAGTLLQSVAGGGYDGVPVSAVAATITDNDVPGVSVVESGGSTIVAEGGATDTYTVVLTAQPSGDVTIFAAGDIQAGVLPSSRVFSTANWFTPQTFTAFAVDDALPELQHAGSIGHTVAGGGFGAVPPFAIAVAVLDNDSTLPSLLLTPSGGSLDVTEGGATDTYTAVLSEQPSDSVVVTISSGSQASTIPSQLVFSVSDWDEPQTVTVFAVDDGITEGDHAALITHSAIGGGFSGAPIETIVVVIHDNDSRRVIISASAGESLSFSAIDDTQVSRGSRNANFGSDTDFTVDDDPRRDGLLRFSVSGVSGRPIARASLRLYVTDGSDSGGQVFATSFSNWTEETVTWNNAPGFSGSVIDELGSVGEGAWQEFDVLALVTGDGVVSMRLRSNSANRVDYATKEFSATFAPRLILELGAGTTLAVSEGGGGAVYTVALNSQPAGTTTITVTPDEQLTAVPRTLLFTSANWRLPQTVTLLAIDDNDVEGPHTGTVRHTASGGGYTGIAVPSVEVQIADNDAPGVRVTESGGFTRVGEDGQADSYTIVLTSRPSTTVVVSITADDDLAVFPLSLRLHQHELGSAPERQRGGRR